MTATAERSPAMPWHAAAWARLSQARAGDRLPHALLITGMVGVGKALFARRLADALVCTEPDADGEACGHCRSCQLSSIGHHPDIHWYRPEEGSKVIKVEAVRELTRSSGLTAGASGRAVYLVDPADGMNPAAANALLKTLEEPPGGAVLVLLSANPDRLTATIRSRCQRIALPPPDGRVASDWLVGQGVAEAKAQRLLGLYGGAPLAALAAAGGEQLDELDTLWTGLERLAEGRGDPVALAGSWESRELAEVLDWLVLWTLDLLRLQAVPGSLPRFDPAAAQRFQTLANRLDCKDLHGFLDCLYELRRRLSSNLNGLLALERLLIDWTRLTARTP